MDYYFVRFTIWININTIPSRLLFDFHAWISRFTTITQNKEVYECFHLIRLFPHSVPPSIQVRELLGSHFDILML